jgi:glycosyltransferase involved in cell wall biosynthesis
LGRIPRITYRMTNLGDDIDKVIKLDLINILFIIYDLDRGGPEMRLLDLAENLPSDIRMFVCVTSNRLSLLDRFKRINVKVNVVPVNKAYLDLPRIMEIIKIVRINQINIVNTYDLKGLIIALFIKFFSGRAVTLIHHAVDLLHNYQTRHRIALRLLLMGVDKIVSNSSEAKELFGKNYFPHSMIELIHNGVDVEKYNIGKLSVSNLKQTLGFSKESVVLGTVANFREEKEYPFLLSAFKQLSVRFPQLRLICVGGGPLLDDMKRLAAVLEVAEKTVFTGYVENVPDFMGVMNVFVLCSSKEGFPNVLIQAMSMEIPVVASAVGGCLEIVDDGKDGFLFTSGDTAGFIGIVCRLIENGKLAILVTRRAREKVNARFTLTRMIEHYMDYFRKCVRNRDQICPEEVLGLK